MMWSVIGSIAWAVAAFLTVAFANGCRRLSGKQVSTLPGGPSNGWPGLRPPLALRPRKVALWRARLTRYCRTS